MTNYNLTRNLQCRANKLIGKRGTWICGWRGNVTTLFENADFWKAIAAMLWPLVAIVIFVSARTRIYAFLQRDDLSIKVGGMELTVANATQNLGKDVGDLQQKVSELEAIVQRIGGQNAKPQDGALDDRALMEAPKIADEAVRPKRSVSILWVDDYPENNAFLIERFRNDGIEIEIAKTTREAIDQFEFRRPDLIITDLGRREDGKSYPFAGLDLIKKIHPLDPSIPIAVYAGERGVQNRQKLLEAGAKLVSQSGVELQSFVNTARR